MKKTITKFMTVMLALMLSVFVLAGCGEAAAPAAPEPEPEEGEEYYEEENFDEENFDEDADIEDYEEVEDLSDLEEDATAEDTAPSGGELSNDQIVALAQKHSGAPKAELDQVMDNGNLYIHLYEDMGDHTATIDWYEIDPKTLTGTNFEGNKIDLSADNTSGAATGADTEGDAGEGVNIADGEYVTDAEYEGELSADGKTMTITTALSEFINSPSPSYPKQTYVINVADSCKCIEIQEDTKENSFFDKMDLIKEFLKGKSGLPITLVFKNNELVAIQFSS